ncbi:uncharacterized protein YggE [Flavobacterium arsenatis]|uniref:Uncharacterized protein YggE n=1 Tax=Flavobacterium arsenatis TaxID=1484332 RepID=A0ABU1TNE8_9FLAO|nr:SIMPL domain-containing protein [Flavobacterium arsenatis]MDR6967460.1 uncharacterized protein YggE [Flavobacterium arsenatis]
MKKTFLILMTMVMTVAQAQEIKQVPLISVSGEGKVKVAPDQVSISISVETRGNNSAEVKKQNDEKIDAVIKYIKKANIAKEDYQTQRVSLNPQYDYEKKKTSFYATQTIQILLKDLSKYDELMEGLVSSGVNSIGNIEFKSSKMEQHKSEARKLAMKDAKAKADDFVAVTGQKTGMAYNITDNSQPFYPQRMYATMEMKSFDSAGGARETLAIGEIEIIANVTVSYILAN